MHAGDGGIPKDAEGEVGITRREGQRERAPFELRSFVDHDESRFTPAPD